MKIVAQIPDKQESSWFYNASLHVILTFHDYDLKLKPTWL